MIFNQQSMQMMGFEGAPVQNVTDQMIRPLFLNASVLVLFVLPMITMRTYSEEKRSGTIELLLTSPLTDFQIIMGKFLGAMALYGAMLAVTFVHMGILYAFGSPERSEERRVGKEWRSRWTAEQSRKKGRGGHDGAEQTYSEAPY